MKLWLNLILASHLISGNCIQLANFDEDNNLHQSINKRVIIEDG